MSQFAEIVTPHPRVCPFLTRVGSSGHPVLQPDVSHRCALADVDAPLRRDVQVRYCLGGRYTLCPAFAAQAAAAATVPPAPLRGLRALALLVITMPLLVMSLLAWHGQERFRGVLSAATVSPVRTTASAADVSEASTAAWTLAISPAPMATAASSPLTYSVAHRVVSTLEPMVTVEATAEISFMALGSVPTPSLRPQVARSVDARDVEPSRGLRLPRGAEHPPDRIVAASIGLDAPVVPVRRRLIKEAEGVTEIWEVADDAAGWHEGSALPGQPGNIVLSGHHNIQGQVFRGVERLRPGDEVVLYADGQAFRYVVELKVIVKEKGEPPEVRQENARWIGPFPDERLTLVTCWPYTSNTHRVIVVARPAGMPVPVDRPVPPAVGPSG
ncbi:MAG: sortase [Anaerolineae bacterium]|nr:sortase [Anaerolineae bacterium]MDW8100392.1 sortase [Anaerolineae bacterium]